jgi:uncharacterized protein (DUF2062 family)
LGSNPVLFKEPLLRHFRGLIRQLLHVDDAPERTALAYAIGVLLGFSPFLGLHTIGGIAIAFLFRLNRVAVLLGAWMNLPWWIVPYYTVATAVGMKVIGFRFDPGLLGAIFRSGMDEGFLRMEFWNRLASQSGLLLSFGFGSMLLAVPLSLIAYPLCLYGIRFYKSKLKKEDGSPPSAA